MVDKVDLVIVAVAVGLAVGIVIATLVFLLIRWYKRVSHLRRSSHNSPPGALPIHKSDVDRRDVLSDTYKNSVTIKLTTYPTKCSTLATLYKNDKKQLPSSPGLLKYSYKDIQKATKNFTTILGQGSFGPVYKAVMPAGEIVAVKTLASSSKQGEKEFQTEVSLLGRLHHRNLVNLVGYSVDKRQRMLIYEYMRNGSLASFLHNEEKPTLNWEERLQIALDISHGIEYLHDGQAVPPVIHRDLKSANILLDHLMRAKVADFGLSKEEVYDDRHSCVKGTYGYIDPMYISTNKFTKKSDIYSFGVILFELITAIHPQQNLIEYVNLAAMSSDGADEILDEKLVGECDLKEVRILARIAHRCLHKTPRKRPAIAEVSQAITKLKHGHLIRAESQSTMSFGGEEFSGVVGCIEVQQSHLQRMASINES